MNDTRLPEGIKSWTSLANVVPSLDDTRLAHRGDSVTFIRNIGWDHDPGFGETFECDVVTMKARAFDELHEIIPDRDALIRDRYFLLSLTQGYKNPGPIIEFIDKLINLI